jgi:hypothetical protein
MAHLIRNGFLLLVSGLAFFLIYYFYWTVESEIIVSDHMSDFIDSVDRHKAKNEKKLVVFDLDDTLFMSSQILGTPTWFYNMINLLRQSGAARHEAYDVVVAMEKVIQDKVHIVPVEQATIIAIRSWQKEGAMTLLGITSRPAELVQITKRQLSDIGLLFSSPYFSCVEESWGEGNGIFSDGVVFSGNKLAKDRSLFRFIDKVRNCGMHVDLIAHADDQRRYVTKVSKFARKNRIEYIGIIYGGAFSSRAFDFAEAKKQLLNLEDSINITIIPEEYRPIVFNDR